ncbi:uncharacterized protein LOC125686427 [Lagopus muta]|uniref:uncharacterized protein LOC125686427 n=1 Tax=Lagopus muta TaxID=64668 RepID=UPI00209D463B|nr:uncharacterized protein LOC125686427 [Lagopus muta]
MDRQAAYMLFTCFSEKRGIKDIDIKKELPGLLQYGQEKGFFVNPHTVHKLSEWRRFGDHLWEATLDGDKVAKKLGRLWRPVHNALLQSRAEKRAAQEIVSAHQRNERYEWPPPIPPDVNVITIPPPGSGGAHAIDPSAPPPGAEPPSQPDLREPVRSAEPIPGAGGELTEALEKQRREAWANLARQCVQEGDAEGANAVQELAFPVVYTPLAAGGMQATILNLDWKLLSQLRATVSQYGITGEPTEQMLDFIWGSQVLLPTDIRGIARLILTQHQRLLFNAHWHDEAQRSVLVQRQPGDPLFQITLDEILGLGNFIRIEAQAMLGPDKLRESMNCARSALRHIRAPGGIPTYMGIQQKRDEAFGSFIDRVAAAIDAAGVPDYMKGAMLKQCALQNCNSATKSILNNLSSGWTIEEALEKMANIPSGPQAFLVQAIKELGEGMKAQAQACQSQVLAALAPLQGPGSSALIGQGPHRTKACHPGNSQTSARRDRRARTQIATTSAQPELQDQSYNLQHGEASAWT